MENTHRFFSSEVSEPRFGEITHTLNVAVGERESGLYYTKTFLKPNYSLTEVVRTYKRQNACKRQIPAAPLKMISLFYNP